MKRARTALKNALVALYCHHLIPAPVVTAGFRLFNLGRL